MRKVPQRGQLLGAQHHLHLAPANVYLVNKAPDHGRRAGSTLLRLRLHVEIVFFFLFFIEIGLQPIEVAGKLVLQNRAGV